jgi:hypothetical protein
MADEQDKGFRVIDRRGREEAPPAPAPGATPPPPAAEGAPSGAAPRPAPSTGGGAPPKQPPEGAPGAGEGNRPPAPGVHDEKGRGEGGPKVGPPRFLDLVQSIQLGAMVSLGMVQGPDGKRPPANLPAAKDAIDILGILQEKTKGNLTREEEEVLREGLYHLRMGYVALLSAPPGGANKGGNKR